MSGIKANLHKFKGRGQTIDVEKIQTLKEEGQLRLPKKWELIEPLFIVYLRVQDK